MRKGINSISAVSNVILNIILSLYALACIVPILIVLSVSLSEEGAITARGYGILPRNFTLAAYKFVFNGSDSVLRAYGVTLFVTIIGSVLSVLMIALFAYPISRKDFKYRNVFAFILFFTMLFNGGLVPWYIVCSQLLHLRNNIWGLMVPYLFNGFWVLVMRTFFSTNIPESILESARIDGAGETRTFFQIVIPLSLPGLATIGLFSTMVFWNDWWLPLLLIDRPELYNLQFLIYKVLNYIQVLSDLASKMGPGASNKLLDLPAQTARMAMCIISIGPIVLAYPFFQRYFVKGLTLGAVKG